MALRGILRHAIHIMKGVRLTLDAEGDGSFFVSVVSVVPLLKINETYAACDSRSAPGAFRCCRATCFLPPICLPGTILVQEAGQASAATTFETCPLSLDIAWL